MDIIPSERKEESFKIYTSERKEESFKIYISNLEDLLKKPEPTGAELKKLHNIVTSNLQPSYPFGKVDLYNMYILDRPDGEEKYLEFIEKNSYKGLTPFEYLEEYKKICEVDTEVDFNPQIKGEIRILGRRKIKGFPEHNVYRTAVKTYPTELEIMVKTKPTAYYMPTPGLDILYNSVCERYDQINKELKRANFDKRLLADSFLQLYGCGVVHPFFDANGRTFGCHLALSLERKGVEIREWGIVAKISERLTSVSEPFLLKVLEDVNLSFISGPEHLALNLDYYFRKNYMEKLNLSIQRGLARGVNENYVKEATWAIKSVLIEEGVIRGSDEELKQIEEDKSKGRWDLGLSYTQWYRPVNRNGTVEIAEIGKPKFSRRKIL
jgi:hypothetical protein